MAVKIKDYVKICPKCGSDVITSFHIIFKRRAEYPTYKCKHCGYEGIIPEVEKSKIEDFKKQIKNKKSQ